MIGMSIEQANSAVKNYGEEVFVMPDGINGFVGNKNNANGINSSFVICKGKIYSITLMIGFSAEIFNLIELYEKKYKKAKTTVKTTRYQIKGKNGLMKRLALKWVLQTEKIMVTI
jgi:hypothetical protein